MYEMYPESWAGDHDARPEQTSSTPARRRVRREHRILPVVVELDARSNESRRPGSVPQV